MNKKNNNNETLPWECMHMHACYTYTLAGLHILQIIILLPFFALYFSKKSLEITFIPAFLCPPDLSFVTVILEITFDIW